jgi:hypothetical protein
MNEHEHLAVSIAARLEHRVSTLEVAPSTVASVRTRARQRQRRRVGSISAVAAIATGSIVALRVTTNDTGRSVAPADTGPLATDVTTASTTSPTSVPPGTEPTTISTPIGALAAPLGLHSTGDDVSTLQRRLHALGFDPGPVDGNFGEATRQAVWAFEGLYLGRSYAQQTGVVDATFWANLATAAPATPRRPGGGSHTEIYLDLQALVVFHNDTPTLVTHISSGSGKQWCETVTFNVDDKGHPFTPVQQQDVCGVARTPGGVFQFYRRFSGNELTYYGGMFNPVYFNYGIAVHGAQVVPKEPVSHGAIRIPDSIALYFPTLVQDGDKVYVFDGTTEPENLTAKESLPVFPYPNPNSTTTVGSG